MHVYERNGFFYILNTLIYSSDWMSEDGGRHYFLLNEVSRTKFIKEVVPYIKAGKCTIDPDAKDKIINYKPIKFRDPSLSSAKIVEPDPIKKPLMPHQIEAVSRMINYLRYGFFLGTGTGKTLIVISYLLSLSIDKALIITPKKVVAQYKEELDKYIPGHKHIVTNYEQAHKYKGQHFTSLILDESHRVKNLSSNLYSDIKEIANNCEECYLFTGTPQDKQRHEVMAQLSILYPQFIPSKTKFINRYFHLDDYYQPKSEKTELSKELTSMIESCTWGKETEEVVDLSACPEQEHIIDCGEPSTLYNILIKDKVFEFPNGAAVVADSKAKLKIKLREICSGFVKVEKVTDEGIKHGSIRLATSPKIVALTSTLQTLPNGIIYAEFKNDIKSIAKVCDAINRSYVIVDGSTTKPAPLIQRFKDKEVDFLIIQNKCGNAGLDLTCTNNMIFFTLPESYIIFHQCKGRIRRKGQTKECNYYYLLCKDTIEYDIFKTLKKKKSYTTRIFKIYK